MKLRGYPDFHNKVKKHNTDPNQSLTISKYCIASCQIAYQLATQHLRGVLVLISFKFHPANNICPVYKRELSVLQARSKGWLLE